MKENKIKIDFHDIDMNMVNSAGESPFNLLGRGGLSWYVYKEKDYSLFMPNKGFKDKIELFFNNQTKEIASYFLTEKKKSRLVNLQLFSCPWCRSSRNKGDHLWSTFQKEHNGIELFNCLIICYIK